jgi:type VI protein secretion system component Hcp
VVAKIVLDSGEIDGGSEVEGHAGEVEFDSLNFEQLSQEGGVDFIDLNWSKLMDRASVLLLQAKVDGDHIVSARFDFIKADESGAVRTHLSVEYKDGEVTEFQYAGDDPSGGSRARGSFRFKRP